VRHEHELLLSREFINGRLQLVDQDPTRVSGFRPSFVRGEYILEQEWHALIRAHRFARRDGLTLLAKPVDDAVPRDAEEPGAHLFDRPQHPYRFHQLGEHLLQDVFGIGDVGDAPADESLESPGLARHDFRDAPVLLDGCSVADQR
jgi:hypothetical protein